MSNIAYLEAHYSEEGHYVVTVGTTFTPTTMKYSVFDEDDNVVNSLSSSTVGSLSTATQIALDGDDLAISNRKKTKKYVTVYGTYNAGANKFSGMAVITGDNLKGIPTS